MMRAATKSQRTAWDDTMREEVGMGAPGATAQKRMRTTRAMRDRSTVKKQNVHGGISDLEFKRVARLERLELTNAWDPLERTVDNADDQDSSGDERKRRKADRRSSFGARKQVFMSDVILAEGMTDFVRAQARPSLRPAQRVCDITGKEGRYQDPLTGLYVHDRRAIAMLREQVPSWMKATAISPYWDAVRTVQVETADDASE